MIYNEIGKYNSKCTRNQTKVAKFERGQTILCKLIDEEKFGMNQLVYFFEKSLKKY
jgi:hypothetical protein